MKGVYCLYALLQSDAVKSPW